MITISSVTVAGMRSLQSISIEKLGNLTALVGKNSSGKSNVLRALNLFFNDEVQPGQKPQFSRDLYEQTKRRQKKRIGVSVSFTLAPSFKLRKQQEYLSIFGSEFTITKSWELDPQRNIVTKYSVVDANSEPIAGASELAA